MNEQADVMVGQLEQHADGAQVVDLFEYITRATLGMQTTVSGRTVYSFSILMRTAARWRPPEQTSSARRRWARRFKVRFVLRGTWGAVMSAQPVPAPPCVALLAHPPRVCITTPSTSAAACLRSDASGWHVHTYPAQTAGREHPYVTAVYAASRYIVERLERPWLLWRWLYLRTERGQRAEKTLDLLHGPSAPSSAPSSMPSSAPSSAPPPSSPPSSAPSSASPPSSAPSSAPSPHPRPHPDALIRVRAGVIGRKQRLRMP